MKTQNSFKRMIAVVFVLFALLTTASADWLTYDASVTPADYGFSAGSSGDNFIGTADLVADPDNAGNMLLDMRSAKENRYYWKNSFGDAFSYDNGFTVVFRMKAENTDSGKVAEFQVYDGVAYDKVYFSNNKVDLNKDGESSVSVTSIIADYDIKEFNIYRITFKDSVTSIWINDQLVLSGASTAGKGDAPKFVFGDSSDGTSYGATYDWIIWDLAGAYAPSTGADYPAGYVISPLVEEVVGDGDWTIYDASQTFAEYGCSAGSSKDFGGDVNVIADVDNAGNSLVELIGPDTLKNYWKFYLTDSATIADDGVTIITRMKAENDSTNMAAIQITTGAFYAKIYVKKDGSLKVDGDATYSTGLDFSTNHIFRVTMTGSELDIWVDDVKYCNAYTVTSGSTNSPSFRIGDASTSDAYSSVIDWIIFDETGAYAPGEGSAYPSTLVVSPLSGGEVVIPDALYFAETTVAVSQAGETIDASLEANTAWSLECDDSWITSIKPLAGDSGVATFAITAEANLGAAPRTATIYGMIGEEEMDKLYITQTGVAVQITASGATASSSQFKDGAYKDVATTIDGDNTTSWVAQASIPNGSSEWVKLAVPANSEVVMVKITEAKNDARLTGFSIDYWNGSAYVEILAQQLSEEQAAANTEMSFSLPSTITTDTVKFIFYGNAGLSETDPTKAEGWLTISELSVWGEPTSSSIRSIDGVAFNVYPNPSTGVFTIENASGANVQLISLAGRVLLERSNISSKEQISLDAPSGMYLLKVGGAISKIVIE